MIENINYCNTFLINIKNIGLFFGYIDYYVKGDTTIEINNAIKIFYYSEDKSIEDIANNGFNKGTYIQVSNKNDLVFEINKDDIELYECSEKLAKQILNAEPWTNLQGGGTTIE